MLRDDPKCIAWLRVHHSCWKHAGKDYVKRKYPSLHSKVQVCTLSFSLASLTFSLCFLSLCFLSLVSLSLVALSLWSHSLWPLSVSLCLSLSLCV